MAKIVLVDDCDPTRRMLLRGVRAAMSADADPAASDDAAARELLAAPAAFDVILTDADARAASPAPSPAAIFRPFLK